MFFRNLLLVYVLLNTYVGWRLSRLAAHIRWRWLLVAVAEGLAGLFPLAEYLAHAAAGPCRRPWSQPERRRSCWST